jgi:hypothetical protein
MKRPRQLCSASALVHMGCMASLVLGMGLWYGQRPRGAASAVSVPTQGGGNALAWTTKPIEALRVGDRVLTTKAAVGKTVPTRVNPATWRLVKLQAWERWADGTLDDIHIETLQPPAWLAAHRVRVGARVPLPLDLVEMGLPEGLRGEVLAVEPCPRIRPGPGWLVLTTVNHLNAYVLELTVADRHGHRETIRPTGCHRFFRAADDRWVSANSLRPNDRLQGQSGLLRVVAKDRVPGVHRVYNLTVEGEHVYRVSHLGALVHNMCPPNPRTPDAVAGRPVAKPGYTPPPAPPIQYPPKIQNQMPIRGWTPQQVQEAIANRPSMFPAINYANGNPASGFVHPTTGQTVIIDNVTGNVIHVGGPGFHYHKP